MRRIVSAATALSCALAVHAQVFVREPATKAHLVAGKTTIALAVTNGAAKPLDAIILLEWLGPDNKRHDFARTASPIPPGDSTFEIALPLSDKFDPLTERLRYDIEPGERNYTSFLPVKGVLSLPNIAAYAFTLNILASQPQRPGNQFHVSVLTFHPVTGKPVSGVKVECGKTAVVSDANGMALLPLPFPSDEDGDDGLIIHANLGDFHQSGRTASFAPVKDSIRIDTDKPLYQPGQTMHVRILALSAAGPARANTEHQIRISDADDEPVHTDTVTTSRFGIASTDWEIPPNAKAGHYKIEVERDDLDSPFTQTIEIRRYELPSFRVTATPKRPFYLLNQPPTVKIQADYLFGKPVPAGSIRITEGDGAKPVIEGKLDQTGAFHATLSATTAIPGGLKFEDRQFTAFVTDPSTNRTEQRQFDIRISRDPLHVYVAKLESTAKTLRLYVSVYTPDGTPAKTRVQLVSRQQILASGTTNRFGVARLEFAKAKYDDPAVIAESPDATYTREPVAIADDDKKLWLDTDLLLYRTGQPVHCRIASTLKNTPVALIAWNNADAIVYSQNAVLANGEATIAIPYNATFGRELSIAAVCGATRAIAARKVIFPGPDELTVRAVPAKSTYRPGETATIQFQTSAPSALGVTIVDQSILERAATDSGVRDSAMVASAVTENDLLNLDPAKIDSDLQMVAATLLPEPYLVNSAGDSLEAQRREFEKAGAESLENVKRLLDERYLNTLDYPTDESGLVAILGAAYTHQTDPWMRPWYTRFTTEGPFDVVQFMSAGPDKQQNTADDYVALEIRRGWFANVEAVIRNRLKGLVDYPATAGELIQVLDAAGIRFEALRDPWGGPLHVAIFHEFDHRRIALVSAGPDHTFDTADDCTVASFVGTYFAATAAKISSVIDHLKQLPATPQQVHTKLSDGGIDFDALRDPWGHAYYITVNDRQSYGDFVTVYTYSEYRGTPEQRRQLTPIKQTFRIVEIRSAGEDGIRGNYDDFPLATFSHRLDEPAPVLDEPTRPPGPVVAGTGALAGTVTDVTGAVIPNARVILDDVYGTETDTGGRYSFAGVKPGKHRLKFESRGFQVHVMDSVPVAADHVTQADTVLNVGTVSEAVEVYAMTASPVNTALARTASTGVLLSAISTPRVREYFPETLYWQPELITAGNGSASIHVKLADSITTWRVAAVASTEDGRISETSADLRAFQPFMVDLDVPPVLTAGDEIHLPVPVRNYLDQPEKVRVSAVLPSQVSLRAPIDQPPQIAPSSSANAALSLRAESRVDGARIRVTGIGHTSSDAIEKPVSIHPDGERRDLTINGVAREGAPLHLALPADVITGSLQAEVKFYPSLLARLLESMQALLTRPWGCGEQTISSTYPNLLFLRAMKNAHLEHDRLQSRALKNLLSGYQRLLGYQDEGGGFTYWGRGDPDIALTSYAVRFLNDAKEFIAVDNERIAEAQRWLENQRTTEPATDGLRIRALAPSDMDRMLGHLARQAAKFDDPYAIAVFALAAMDAGKKDVARPAIEHLRTLAQDEQGAAFWSLRANTPFHGWGRSGQLETTALAVSALARWRKLEAEKSGDALIDRGVLFLLKNADHTGAWYTTQSTVRVLDALLDVWSGAGLQKSLTVTVLVNGAKAGTVAIPAANEVREPVTLDVSKFLHFGSSNDISFTGTDASAIQAQVNANWYETWKQSPVAKTLRFEANCTPGQLAVNEAVTCDVLLSRPSFRGYGMVIAEVGLPPGAEVDRGTLASLVDDRKTGVDSFEVAPDHVTFYVWPRAEDSKFHFVFRPRFAMSARSAQSLAYDYYNPDERTVVAPTIFTVQ